MAQMILETVKNSIKPSLNTETYNERVKTHFMHIKIYMIDVFF